MCITLIVKLISEYTRVIVLTEIASKVASQLFGFADSGHPKAPERWKEKLDRSS